MTSLSPALDAQPGFRRRIRISPVAGRCRAQLEDDYHCMSVTLHHDNGVVQRVDASMHRAPWTTCPGAEAKVVETFTGLTLSECAIGGKKQQNCTHLYDLAQWAAEHAGESDEITYDVLVSDPVDGVREAELRRNGEPLFCWRDSHFQLLAPPEIAGIRLDKLTPWLESQPDERREAAKILRWAMMVAHGRQIPLEQQSDARKMPPNCYTFQPHRAVEAKRVGKIYDFSSGTKTLLDSND